MNINKQTSAPNGNCIFLFRVLSFVNFIIKFGKNIVSEIEKYTTIRDQFENVNAIGCKNAARKTILYEKIKLEGMSPLKQINTAIIQSHKTINNETPPLKFPDSLIRAK